MRFQSVLAFIQDQTSWNLGHRRSTNALGINEVVDEVFITVVFDKC